MLISGILKRKGDAVAAVGPDATVEAAANLLARNRIGSVLVCEGAGPEGSEACREPGAVLGILSERDIVRALSVNGAACLAQPVSDLMTKDVVTCTPEDSVQSVMALMTEKRIRHVPVMEGGNDGKTGARLAGIVSIGDVVKHRLEEAEAEAAQLEAYVRSG